MYNHGDVTCDLCGTRLKAPYGITPTNYAIYRGWDYFTGNRATTFHACQTCCLNRTAEVEQARLEAGPHARREP